MPPKKNKRKKKNKSMEEYCGVCNGELWPQIIQCSYCERHFHWDCVGVDWSIEEDEDWWLCDECHLSIYGSQNSNSGSDNSSKSESMSSSGSKNTNSSESTGSSSSDSSSGSENSSQSSRSDSSSGSENTTPSSSSGTENQENCLRFSSSSNPKSESRTTETGRQTIGHKSHKADATDNTQNQDRTSQHTRRRSQNKAEIQNPTSKPTTQVSQPTHSSTKRKRLNSEEVRQSKERREKEFLELERQAKRQIIDTLLEREEKLLRKRYKSQRGKQILDQPATSSVAPLDSRERESNTPTIESEIHQSHAAVTRNQIVPTSIVETDLLSPANKSSWTQQLPSTDFQTKKLNVKPAVSNLQNFKASNSLSQQIVPQNSQPSNVSFNQVASDMNSNRSIDKNNQSSATDRTNVRRQVTIPQVLPQSQGRQSKDRSQMSSQLESPPQYHSVDGNKISQMSDKSEQSSLQLYPTLRQYTSHGQQFSVRSRLKKRNKEPFTTSSQPRMINHQLSKTKNHPKFHKKRTRRKYDSELKSVNGPALAKQNLNRSLEHVVPNVKLDEQEDKISQRKIGEILLNNILPLNGQEQHPSTKSESSKDDVNEWKNGNQPINSELVSLNPSPKPRTFREVNKELEHQLEPTELEHHGSNPRSQQSNKQIEFVRSSNQAHRKIEFNESLVHSNPSSGSELIIEIKQLERSTFVTTNAWHELQYRKIGKKTFGNILEPDHRKTKTQGPKSSRIEDQVRNSGKQKYISKDQSMNRHCQIQNSCNETTSHLNRNSTILQMQRSQSQNQTRGEFAKNSSILANNPSQWLILCDGESLIETNMPTKVYHRHPLSDLKIKWNIEHGNWIKFKEVLVSKQKPLIEFDGVWSPHSRMAIQYIRDWSTSKIKNLNGTLKVLSNWICETVNKLAKRIQWYKPVAPLKQGDLMLIVDENNLKAKIWKTEIGLNGQARRAKVEIISSTKSNTKGQITKVTETELWRSAHKSALFDVASDDSLAQPRLDRKTGGSVGATKFKSKVRAKASHTNETDATGSLGRLVTSSNNCQVQPQKHKRY